MNRAIHVKQFCSQLLSGRNQIINYYLCAIVFPFLSSNRMHLQGRLAKLAGCSALQWCYWHKRPVKGRRAQAKAKLRLGFNHVYPSLTSHLLEPTSCIMYDYPAWSRWQDSGAWRRRSHLRRWPSSSPPLLFLPFLPPSVQEEVATTLWPSVPSWNSNESSLLSIWWDYIWNNYHSAVYLK